MEKVEEDVYKRQPEGDRLTLEWYAPGKTIPDGEGGFTVAGEPYKTAVYELSLIHI